MITRTRALTGGGSNGSPRTSGGAVDQSYRPPRLVSGRRRKYGCVRSASLATVKTKRRVSSAPAATVGVPSSSRSRLHPAGAAILTLSTRTALSLAFQTLTSTCNRSPGMTIPSSAAPSIVTPAAVLIARASSARCSESAGPSSRSARTRYGTMAAGRQGVSTARAESISAAYPVTCIVVSTPLKIDVSPPLLPAGPVLAASSATPEVAGPGRCSWPMSCERWRLRLAAATWKYDCPMTGSSMPIGSERVVAVGSPRVER